MQRQDERGETGFPQTEEMDLPQMRQDQISDQKEEQR
jgi:hypothetical protein